MAVRCPKCQFDNTSDSKFCKECGTQLIPSEGPQVSKTLTLETKPEGPIRGAVFAGRYEILEALGAGGMGAVYRVHDRKLGEEVALKLIRPEIGANHKAIERFRNEIKISRKITHKNVCRMHDLGEAEGTSFITMEYVRGEDLKPGNIMIDKDGNAKIMDFGIARSLAGLGTTAEGVVIGTPEYMSPEQVEGKPADQLADIYALGVILFEMVTGRLPFEGETPFSIANKHKTEPPPIPKKLVPHIPDGLNNLILRCLEKDKTKRYRSAEELRADLEKVEQGLPTTERIIAKRKPFTSRQITVQFDLKRLLKPAFVIVSVAAAALVIWKLLPKRPSVPVPSDKPSVAVLYFKNNTGDDKFDVWSTALSDSIITDLSQSKYVRVLTTDQLLSILRRLDLLEARSYASEDLRRVADLGGVRHVLLGSMSKAGESFRIDYALQDMQKKQSVAMDRVEGTGEDSIFTMVDELTRKVKGNLQLTKEQIASDIDIGISSVTTNSPQAYAYLSQAFRFNYQGEFRKSIELLERAIALDPKFATAYSILGYSNQNLGYVSKANECLRRAFELSEDLPDRERYFIQSGYYRQTEDTYDKAIEAFEKRLELEPNEVNAARNLAAIYCRLEQWDRALELSKVNIESGVEAVFPYQFAAQAYSAKGLYNKAQEVLEDYRRIHADMSYIRQQLAYMFLSQGKYDRATTEADKALTLAPSDDSNFLIKGHIQCLAADFSGAEKEYLRLLDSAEKPGHLSGRASLWLLHLGQGKFGRSFEEAKQGILLSAELADRAMESSFLRRSAYIHLQTGKPKEALPELDQASDAALAARSISGQISSLCLKGIALLETDSIAEALIAAEEIKKLVEGWLNPKLMRFYHLLLGKIELKRGNHSKAIQYLNQAITFLDYQRGPDDAHALFHEPLALAHYRSGDFAKAQEWYEKIAQLTTGRLSYGDIYAKSFYMRGKINEQKGERTLAAENYRKFLDLWEAADPGLPEVEDARKRLAGLN